MQVGSYDYKNFIKQLPNDQLSSVKVYCAGMAEPQDDSSAKVSGVFGNSGFNFRREIVPWLLTQTAVPQPSNAGCGLDSADMSELQGGMGQQPKAGAVALTYNGKPIKWVPYKDNSRCGLSSCMGTEACNGGWGVNGECHYTGATSAAKFNHVKYYGATYVYSATARQLWLQTGSDDGHVTSLNGKIVANMQKACRCYATAADVNFVTLKKGWNTIIIKVGEGGGNTGFVVGFDKMDGLCASIDPSVGCDQLPCVPPQPPGEVVCRSGTHLPGTSMGLTKSGSQHETSFKSRYYVFTAMDCGGNLPDPKACKTWLTRSAGVWEKQGTAADVNSIEPQVWPVNTGWNVESQGQLLTYTSPGVRWLSTWNRDVANDNVAVEVVYYCGQGEFKQDWTTFSTTVLSQSALTAWVASDPVLKSALGGGVAASFPANLALQSCAAGSLGCAVGAAPTKSQIDATVRSYMKWKHPEIKYSKWRLAIGKYGQPCYGPLQPLTSPPVCATTATGNGIFISGSGLKYQQSAMGAAGALSGGIGKIDILVQSESVYKKQEVSAICKNQQAGGSGYGAATGSSSSLCKAAGSGR